MANMQAQYGEDKGERVFYATAAAHKKEKKPKPGKIVRRALTLRKLAKPKAKRRGGFEDI